MEGPLVLHQSPPDNRNPITITGRRIVNLELLSDNLEKGCMCCHAGLKLCNIISEKRYGLGSILVIRYNSI